MAKLASFSIIQCPKCGFAWNIDFDSNKATYHNYTFSLRHSEKYQKHAKWLIEKISKKYKIFGSKILEIGCGDADFLYHLSKTTQSKGMGYEPSFKNRIELLQQIEDGYKDFADYVTIIPDYFTEEGLKEKFQLVICRHVLEHIPNPSAFISSLFSNLRDMEDVIILFEVPNLDYIITSQCLTHFIYEHCNYFSSLSLQKLFQNNGFNVLEMDTCYDGAFQIIIATNKKNKSNFLKIQRSFFKDILLEKKRKIKTQIDKNSRIAIWGASNSGNIVYNTVQDICTIQCFIDSNAEKYRGFMANSGLPIVSLDDALLMDINTIIIANPVYNTEIQQIIFKKNISIKIIFL